MVLSILHFNAFILLVRSLIAFSMITITISIYSRLTIPSEVPGVENYVAFLRFLMNITLYIHRNPETYKERFCPPETPEVVHSPHNNIRQYVLKSTDLIAKSLP